MKVLIIGGSGFLSGTLARLAVAEGHRVQVVTRGQRPLPEGVEGLTADRKDRRAFAAAIAGAGGDWDLVCDCIGYSADDARQDLDCFTGRAGHLVFVSTDFVYDPAHRRFPQPEESEHYLPTGYGGGKREAELALQAAGADGLPWTVVRPGHIYGPGSRLGCLPAHARDPELVEHLRAGRPVRLVAAGSLLQQPIFAKDLARVMLSAPGHDAAIGQIFCTAGPEAVQSVTYYEIIAEHLGVELKVEEVPLLSYRAEHPEHASFLCHRVYSLAKLKASGLAVPETPLAEGLGEHVRAVVEEG